MARKDSCDLNRTLSIMKYAAKSSRSRQRERLHETAKSSTPEYRTGVRLCASMPRAAMNPNFRKLGGGVSISLRPIDQEIGERNISFLKLDVEGFELAALQGAEQAIRRCRPRMAVCAYHKLEDLLKIPKWILDLEMGYTLQLRMYSNEYLEIVCYAY